MPNVASIGAFLCFSGVLLQAQEQGPSGVPRPADEPAPGAGVSAGQIANANNPLANMDGLSFQDYYAPAFYGVSGVSSNTLDLRPVFVSGRQVIRLTIPISTVPAGRSTIDLPGGGALPAISLPIGPVQYDSGIGDASIFDAIVLTPSGASTTLAAGPQLVAPSATNSSLGSGRWQAGLAGVVIHPLPGGSLLGALITWQHSFAGDKDRPSTNVGVFQPSMTAAIGGGFYIRSTAAWTLDFKNDIYLIPVGLGAGKVFKLGSALANAFFEPQFTVYHKGRGLPVLSLFFGLNLQWAKKPK